MYKCEVGDVKRQNDDEVKIRALSKNETIIEITELTEQNLVEISPNVEGKVDVKFSVIVTGHPKPEAKWFDNHGVEIRYSPVSDRKSKHEIQTNDSSTTLIIRNPDLDDFGNYTMKATNGLIEKQKQFRLIVKGEPIVTAFLEPFETNFDLSFFTFCSSSID